MGKYDKVSKFLFNKPYSKLNRKDKTKARNLQSIKNKLRGRKFSGL